MSNAAVAIDEPGTLTELLERELGDSALLRLTGIEDVLPGRLWDCALRAPLREFLGRPGKQFRAELARTGFLLCGGRGELPDELPLAVELLHAGSLIVDDIEDESPERRGGPSLHRMYGLPLALNTGNWLYFWPFALVERLDLPDAVRTGLERAMSRTLLRCHLGQALDLSVRFMDLAQGEVVSAVVVTTKLKSGALMELSAGIGAACAGARPEQLRAVERFGQELGVGLQMFDDLGAITSERRCAKGHEDLLLARPTWPWAWLARDLDAIRFGQLRLLARKVHERTAHPEELAERMRELVQVSGKQRARQHLHAALELLRQSFPASPALGDLLRELQRLEASYE
jgi:geranylgeranyl pyrophosphate synthase